MRDLIVQGDAEIKSFTLSYSIIIGGITFPAGTVFTGRFEYFYPVLDNDPTFLNKGTLLSDDTQELIGLPPDSPSYVGTPNEAFKRIGSLLNVLKPSTFQQIMTERFI